MTLRFANSTGQAAVYHTGTPYYLDVADTHAAEPEAFKFAEAATEGGWQDGDWISVRVIKDTDTFLLWLCAWREATQRLEYVAQERAVGTFNDGDAVVVRAVPTAMALTVGINDKRIIDVTESRPIAISDRGGVLCVTSTDPVLLTVPDALPVGFHCTVVREGQVGVSVAPSGAETLNGASSTIELSTQWGSVELYRRAEGAWLLLANAGISSGSGGEITRSAIFTASLDGTLGTPIQDVAPDTGPAWTDQSALPSDIAAGYASSLSYLQSDDPWQLAGDGSASDVNDGGSYLLPIPVEVPRQPSYLFWRFRFDSWDTGDYYDILSFDPGINLYDSGDTTYQENLLRWTFLLCAYQDAGGDKFALAFSGPADAPTWYGALPTLVPQAGHTYLAEIRYLDKLMELHLTDETAEEEIVVVLGHVTTNELTDPEDWNLCRFDLGSDGAWITQNSSAPDWSADVSGAPLKILHIEVGSITSGV